MDTAKEKQETERKRPTDQIRRPSAKRLELGALAARILRTGASKKATVAALTTENRLRFKKPVKKAVVLKIVKALPEVGRPPSEISDWPEKPENEVFRGIVRTLTRAVSPHSETSPIAIAVQMLAAFGNMIGRGPHFKVDAGEHHMNLFAVIVGSTGESRKGSSWSICEKLMDLVDPAWRPACVRSDVASGEGLVALLGASADNKTPGTDRPAAAAPRLFLLEKEFGQLLRVCKRPGNTLSSLLRKAWDGDDLANITKAERVVVQGAHVSAVGHITPHEVKKELGDGAAANGLANRFLWIAVRKSKDVPDGGHLEKGDLEPIAAQMIEAIAFARGVGQMSRSENAERMWRKLYPQLGESEGGLIDDLTARAHPQVMRLSCLYALLDRSERVMTPHLRAAIELWRYSHASVRHIFSPKDTATQNRILAALRANQNGLTRTEIRDLFGRSKDANIVSQALNDLAARKLIYSVVDNRTGGHPATRWKAV